MNTIKIAFIFCLFVLSNTLHAQSAEDVEAYIERFKQIAMQEQITYGVPASITLAQGLHESACGLSELATQANNHFGIKCKSTWKGQTYLHDDDAPKECFRKYPSADQSYRDHSIFLKENNRYHFLFDIEVTDYKAWASGLKRAGYATNPAYVSRLTNLIEKYNLQQYTYDALNKAYATPKEVVPVNDNTVDPKTTNTTTSSSTAAPEASAARPVAPSTQYYKGLQGFWAKKGDMLTKKAIELNIRYPRLLMLNDLADAPLEHDQFIFTEKKRKVGTNEYHIVKDGEDMHAIAQMEAMMLDYVYQYNNMRPGQEPASGERLNLQYRAMEVPQLRGVETAVNRMQEENKAAPNLATSKETIQIQSKVEEPLIREEPKQKVEEIPVVIAEEKVKAEERIEIKVEETPRPVISTPPTTEINNPILDEAKAKKVEALLAPNSEGEVEALAAQQKKEKEERERMEREMMERIKKNDDYAKNVTAKIDEDRRQVEARQDEELKKRRAMEEEERKRIEEEQLERERLEALQANKLNEQDRIRQEQNAQAVLLQQQEEARLTKEKEEFEKAERIRKDEEARKKRKYNEQGISDSVKSLKRNYDNIVYRSLPERKPLVQPKKDSVIPSPRLPKPVKPASKSTTVKPTETKTAENNTKVTKTATGIKRDVKDKKKDDASAVVSSKNKTAQAKKDATKNASSKKDDPKKDDKKAKDKKESAKKGKEETSKTKKSTPAKKTEPAKKTKK